MRIEDAVKLLYQSEFAGGHIIEDEDESLESIKRECAALEKRDVNKNGEAFEEIGGGLCRLDLRALETLGIEASTVNRFFVETAGSVSGSTERFEQKLDALLRLCRSGELPFDAIEAEQYIDSLKAKGYPAVSHSEEYRRAYAPAYRVVKSAYRDYIGAFIAIDALVRSGQINVAIDGGCGAGKSALASLISGVYDCSVFHMDDFFLMPSQRTQERLQEAGGNVDYERFSAEVIEGIKSGREFCYRRYDCKSQTLEAVTALPKQINIIEGSYSMHPFLISFYGLKIFLQIDAGEQSARILKRNGPLIYKRFMSEWVPMENNYFTQFKIRDKADIVFAA